MFFLVLIDVFYLFFTFKGMCSGTNEIDEFHASHGREVYRNSNNDCVRGGRRSFCTEFANACLLRRECDFGNRWGRRERLLERSSLHVLSAVSASVAAGGTRAAATKSRLLVDNIELRLKALFKLFAVPNANPFSNFTISSNEPALVHT